MPATDANRAVTKLPQIPMPMVPPRVLANWWEEVATPRSFLSTLFWTMRRVAMEVNPMPAPAMARAIAQVNRSVDSENLTAMLDPRTNVRPPAREKAFFPQWLHFQPQTRAPADQPKLRNIMAIPSCMGDRPKAPCMKMGLKAEREKIAALLKKAIDVPVVNPLELKNSKQKTGSLLRFSAR